MTKVNLDIEEQELLDAYESDEYQSDLDANRKGYRTKWQKKH
ncbi:hypothetical protein [Marinospirillum insulare]|uniref:Uncharacterized protein n=1 Tax=Marinospirillum insulare TaxID=217169 RepID=A0ABQ5ZTA7_9GAMM|nr:hypothetical protein [Marinospirillum insulare]GLR63384.1 hypothetical protein GCM10007878_08190 [Marinospirillum insulare]